MNKLGFILFLATTCLCYDAFANQQLHNADKAFVIKQKHIYELFWHVNQPTIYHPELYDKARSFNLEAQADSFTNKEVVNEFLKLWKHGMLPRGHIFSVMYPQHLTEMKALFDLFYYAKNFDTFYNAAVWARFNVNEPMFVYALTVAVLHRPDCKHIRVPPLYEVVPHFFFNSDVIHHAYHIKMGDTGPKKSTGGVDQYIIHTNYSGWYLSHDHDSEFKLNYFTEDIGLNSFYFFMCHDFPFWMKSNEYKLVKEVRGEQYFYAHKQLLVRYYLERLSHGLGEIEYLDWNKPIATGYYPSLVYPNGLTFPERGTWNPVPPHKYHHLQVVQMLENRVSAFVDSDYVKDHDLKPTKLTGADAFNALGNLIEGNEDSANHRYYGSMDRMYRDILGFNHEFGRKYHIQPSALEIFSTSMRDPGFYRMYKRLLSFMFHYKSYLPAYTHEELTFPGVKVVSVAVDKLVTFFDDFDAMISNAVSVHSHKEAQATLIRARQYRLNHKPFTYHMTVSSDKATKAIVRVFLGPKYDVHHHELDINENWVNYLEMDQWIVDLAPGNNKIERSSHESIYVVPDDEASDVYYKKLMKAFESNEPFTYTDRPYGFPDRLILPRGRAEGMLFKLFVHVGPYDESKAFKFESPIFGHVISDGKPMGFPLDRPVYSNNFTAPNMFFKDVQIYHKQVDELNLTV